MTSTRRIRCLICDKLVQREVSDSVSYAVKPIQIENKRGCICSNCVDNLFTLYNNDLKLYCHISKRSISQYSFTESDIEDCALNNFLTLPTSEEFFEMIEQMPPIPIQLTHPPKASIKKQKISPEKKYACLDYTLDSYFSAISSKVFGHDEAIRTLLCAIYFNQFSNLLEEYDIATEEIRKNHALIIGNTGVGKTFLVTTIAETLKLPFAVCNATSITSAGYIGGKVEDFLHKLYTNANQNLELAQNGILFIDEIDKKKVSRDSAGRDVAGRSVQEELLKLLEPNVIHLKDINVDFDTKNLTIILCGAFEGLNEIVDKRLNKKIIGFENNTETPTKAQIIANDLIEYGIIPELIGRIPAIIPLSPLTKNNIIDIIYSILTKYNLFFKQKHVELIIDDLFIDTIADQLLNSPTGARDIYSKLFTILSPALYRIFQSNNGGICQIDANGNTELLISDEQKKLQNYYFTSIYPIEDDLTS